MDRTSDGVLSVHTTSFEGWNIGAVSVKRVRLSDDGVVHADVHRHGGNPASVIRALLGGMPSGCPSHRPPINFAPFAPLPA